MEKRWKSKGSGVGAMKQNQGDKQIEEQDPWYQIFKEIKFS